MFSLETKRFTVFCSSKLLFMKRGCLLQASPVHRQVLVPFNSVGWHSELNSASFAWGGNGKQLVNMCKTSFSLHQDAKHKSVFRLQTRFRLQLLSHNLLVALHLGEERSHETQTRAATLAVSKHVGEGQIIYLLYLCHDHLNYMIGLIL